MHLSPPHTIDPVFRRTVGFEDIHGDAMTGTHGTGVKTPAAAAVADATAGFERVVHIPHDITFISGTISDTEAAGIPQHVTKFVGNIFKVEGTVPNEHLHKAPQTATGISKNDSLLRS